MKHDRSEALREAWLDACLEEALAHPAPQDLAARIWGRSAWQRTRWRAAGIAAVLLTGAAAVLAAVVLRSGGQARSVAAGPPPVRVLLLDDRPGWDYRYLKNALLRAPGVAAQAWLCSAAPGFLQESSKGVTALQRMPAAVEFRDYDVVLIGDVAPERLGVDTAARAAWWADVRGFVEAGGGLALLAGPDGALARHGKSWPAWLPARLEPADAVLTSVRSTAAAAAHPATQLLPESLPSLTVGRCRLVGQAGVVLLEVEDGPIVVSGSVGEGRVLVSTAGSAWTLRRAGEPGLYDRWWRGLVAWLARREG